MPSKPVKKAEPLVIESEEPKAIVSPEPAKPPVDLPEKATNLDLVEAEIKLEADKPVAISEPQATAPVEKQELKASEVQSQTEQWEGFVHHMTGKVNKSLVSLMRNSVLLEMSENSLTIGFKNTELFSDEKREQVEKEASQYFQRPIEVFYKEDTDGIDDSVREKLEQELERQIEAQKKEAGESPQVKEILDLFPGSSISQIRIISEKEDV